MFLEFCTLTSLSHPYVYTSFLFLWNFCLISFRADGNKAYLLQIGSEKVPVYCHMTSLGECGGYGWTLVMKMNGSLVCTQVLYGSQVLREMFSENSDYDFPSLEQNYFWRSKIRLLHLFRSH